MTEFELSIIQLPDSYARKKMVAVRVKRSIKQEIVLCLLFITGKHFIYHEREVLAIKGINQ